MGVYIEHPPELAEDRAEQARQLYAYLYRLSEALRVSETQLQDRSQVENIVAKAIAENEKNASSGDAYVNLRSLIVKNAEIVRVAMDMLRADLNTTTEAISSQFGTLQETINSQIVATAEAIVQQYAFDSRIQALDEAMAGFSDYQVHTEGFIRSGFVDYREDGTPIIGIAIGQGLTSTTEIIDGVAYEHISRDQNCAFYTSEKLSFRVNGTEVAYFSNNKLHVNEMEVGSRMTIGGKWLIDTTSGFTIDWIGG